MLGLKYQTEYVCPWCKDQIITLNEKKHMDNRRSYKCKTCGKKYGLSGSFIIPGLICIGSVVSFVNIIGFTSWNEKLYVVIFTLVVVSLLNLFATYFVPIAKKYN